MKNMNMKKKNLKTSLFFAYYDIFFPVFDLTIFEYKDFGASKFSYLGGGKLVVLAKIFAPVIS